LREKLNPKATNIIPTFYEEKAQSFQSKRELHARKTIEGHASPPLTSRKTKSPQTLAKRNKNAKMQALPNRKNPKVTSKLY